MTTSQGPAHNDPQAHSTRPSIRRLVQVGVLAGAIAIIIPPLSRQLAAID